MKEVVMLEKQEYQDLLDEIKSLKEYKYNSGNLFKRIPNNEHNYKNNILVVELDVKKLNKLFSFEENSEVIVIKNKESI
jgi:hypothetical protein